MTDEKPDSTNVRKIRAEGGAIQETIFEDRRRHDERRSRGHGTDTEAFGQCRRDRGGDRRKAQNRARGNGQWWLQADYVDWEDCTGNVREPRAPASS